jgi:DNA-binding NarL/FixJ family response regulator
MEKIRIILADDHPILRAGLKLLIENQPDMEVVGEVGDHSLVLEAVKIANPRVLALDWSMPGGNPVRVLDELTLKYPGTRVIVLTMHEDPAYVRLALGAGASGYLLKSAADSELIQAIRQIAKGGIYTQVPKALEVDSPGEKSLVGSKLEQLSQREREVLGQIAQGHTNQAIADRLFLSVKTVESYRARLMAKLGLKSRAELPQFSLESGLFELGKQVD